MIFCIVILVYKLNWPIIQNIALLSYFTKTVILLFNFVLKYSKMNLIITFHVLS
nr:hypothetical protein BAR15_120381 [Bartonella sp. AR 15-3]